MAKQDEKIVTAISLKDGNLEIIALQIIFKAIM